MAWSPTLNLNETSITFLMSVMQSHSCDGYVSYLHPWDSPSFHHTHVSFQCNWQLILILLMLNCSY